MCASNWGGFHEHGEKVTIGELVKTGTLEFGDGYRTKVSEHGWPGYRIIRVADVSENNISFDGPDFVSNDFSRAIGPKSGQPGDILLTTKGTVGRVAVMPPIHEPVVYSPQLCYFRVQDPSKINPRFLRFWFSSPEFWGQAADRMNNTDMAAYINMADIRSLKISLPDTATQQAIAEVLGALDDKIAANTKLAASSENLGSALFQRALQSPDSTTMQLRDLALNVAGKYLAKSDYENGRYFVYGSNSVMGMHSAYLCTGGFAVLAKIGSYCGNLRWSQRPAWVNNNASGIVPKAGTSPSILRHALQSIDMGPHKAGTGQPYIRMESLFSTELTVPGKFASARLGPILESLSEIEAAASEENQTLAATRDTLLPQLMSGKLRVKDAETLVSAAV
ncbi:restriction endonuclease subunit S [Arthrobacter alpinus]|nr:restriction endonuclease subunit S [Arthrobacter alpinus]